MQEYIFQLVLSAILVLTPFGFKSEASKYGPYISIAIESKNHRHHAMHIGAIIGGDIGLVAKIDITNDNEYIATLNRLVDTPYKVINLSLQSCHYTQGEYDALMRLSNAGKIIVAAAGNIGYDAFCTSFPAAYNVPNMIVVGNAISKQQNVNVFTSRSNICVNGDFCMQGSSQSAAFMTRVISEKIIEGYTVEQIISTYKQDEVVHVSVR